MPNPPLLMSVKSRKSARHATSDWMELEKQRGISVTTSVMQFDYANCVFNLLDKVLLIIFQVWSLWLLSYSLCVKKGLKIESSLIISLLLHYGGFTIILVFLV